ncbi:MAG TPA: PRTRC system ThiF family protein [Terriglobia bacterium]|nr:PRTRC system ThiF family protein [Terriglobia bacterium]
MGTHKLHEELLRRRVEVLVVGCGGNGSAIVGGLPYLHGAMLAQGHPYGLHVTVMDGDTISPFNCVRQPFAKSEVGLNKCIVLVNRINLFWGLDWTAAPKALTEETLRPAHGVYSDRYLQPDIVISCVDTRAARAMIAKCVSGPSTVGYAIDLGNSASSGQFILGEPLNERNKRSAMRLRTVGELYPEVSDPALDNDNEPSCSALEAVLRQEPYVNTVLAQHALALLARLFRYGEIAYHGAFIDVAAARAVPLPIDPKLWRRLRRRQRRREAQAA